MKRKALLVLMTFAGILSLASCSNPPAKEDSSYSPISLVEGAENVWLDRYEEADIQFSEKRDGLNYTSSDESVVTVSNGRLFAQGKGTAVVKVSDGTTELSVNVKVRDSGVKPVFSFRSFEAYLNCDTSLPQEVSYNGKAMSTSIVYSVTITDTSVAKYENGAIHGLALGKTTMDVTAEYKGLTLSRKGLTLEIKEPLYIAASSDEVDLHNVSTKLGRYSLDAIVYEKGVAIEGAAIAYSVIEGSDCVRLDGSTVYAVKEGKATIKASFQKDGNSAELLIYINVGPNYEEASFINPSSKDNFYEKVDEHPKGRDEVYAYRADKNVSSADCWESHIVEKTTDTKIVDLYREGKRYFTYDLYYTSNENLMVGCSSLTSWIAVGDFFRKDYLTILKDGQVCDTLEKNTWVTMVYDLKALWSRNLGLSSYFFFFVNDGTTTQYISNVRYYLDDSFLPDENRHYEKKDGYTQATNDEWDIQIPVSKSYSKGQDNPGLVVNPEEVPTYGPSSEAPNRSGAYAYKTKIASSSKNALVVSTSMNETYDDSLYRLSKLGSYFAFDIYPTQETTLDFAINGGNSGYYASCTVDETALSQYEDWLVVYSGTRRLNALKANQWQTVVYYFADSYVEDGISGQMTFSSKSASDLVYIDNCRYYHDSTFVPNEYDEEDRRPTAANGSTNVERLNDGDMRGCYEIASKGESKVSFTEVTPEGEYFSEGYRYYKYDLYLTSDVTSLTFVNKATSGIVNSEDVTIEVGETFSEDLEIYDEDGVKVNMVKANAWYTVYQAVTKQGEAITGLDSSIQINGKNNAKSYIRYVSFLYELHELYLRNMAGYTDNVTCSFQKEGDFKGCYRYENGTSGDVEGESRNWGESGVRFSGVALSDDSGPSSFFRSGYHWISTEIYIEEGMPSFSIRATADRNFENYWVQDIPVNGTAPKNVYAMDKNGKRVETIKSGNWYNLMIPVKYTSVDVGNVYVTVYSNGGSRLKPTVMYFRNTTYLKEADVPEVLPSAIMARSDYSAYVSCEEQEDGSFKYVNGTSGYGGGSINSFHNCGLYFYGVTDPKASTAETSTGKFFQDGYHCIQVDVKFENCSSWGIRVAGSSGLTAYVKNQIAIGATDSDLYLYDSNGDKVTNIEKDTWYTLKIPVLYTEGYANWTDVLLWTNGGEPSSPSVMYLRNLTFLKEFVA